jgi:hypothetical protein
MRSQIRAMAVGWTAVLALFSLGCETQTTPTPPLGAGLPVVDQFVGTLQPSGDAFYSFSMSQAGTVNLTWLR